MKVSTPEELRTWRRNQGKTIKEVAAQLGLSSALVQKIETGMIPISPKTVIRYRDVLGLDLEVVEQTRNHPWHGLWLI